MSATEGVLPAVAVAYSRLRQWGNPFPDADRYVSRLSNATYTHPKRGVQPVMVDGRVVPVVDRIYCGDMRLAIALGLHGGRTAPMERLLDVVIPILKSDELIWGFSGYATGGTCAADGGRSYAVEAVGMELLYEQLDSLAEKIGLVVDGASRTGVLGINGYLAQSWGIPTLGCAPLQGLDAIAPRTYLAVSGQTYRDRERLVGVLPDVLTCVGGGEGARRECLAALEARSVVLLMALKDYPDGSLMERCHSTGPGRSVADLMAAAQYYKAGLVVCRSLKEISAAVDQVLKARQVIGTRARSKRRQLISGLLRSRP